MSKMSQYHAELSATKEAEEGFAAYRRGETVNPYRGTPKEQRWAVGWQNARIEDTAP